MPVDFQLTDLLACPRCDKTPITREDSQYRCTGCKTEFPSLGDIPWMFAHPDSSLGEWRNRLHFELQKLAHEAQRLKAELIAEDQPALTRQRLEAQMKAAEKHRTMLRQVLSPMDIQSAQASYESHLAMRTRLPSDQGLHTYYANIHRDWAWGDEENAASLEEIRKVAHRDGEGDGSGDVDLGDVLVLGAGACRLAYDLHMQLTLGKTVALDFNPLLLLIAKSVMQGETPQFYEFPLAPKSIDDYVVLRKLSAPDPVRDGFSFVLGDVLRPPFAKGVFDTVVTPWLIDIVNEDLPVQAARINSLLREGGRWINFGSLAFDHPDRARRYSPEETKIIVEQAGFTPPHAREETIPYMCSPSSRHGRRETVFTFSAAKIGDVDTPDRHKALPDWIVTGKEPVPVLPSFRTQALTTQVYSYIMSLIDGKRTIADMAKILEQQKLMTRKEAEPAIRNFLTRMYDDSQTKAAF